MLDTIPAPCRKQTRRYNPGRVKSGVGIVNRSSRYFSQLRYKLNAAADLRSGGWQQSVAVPRKLSSNVELPMQDDAFEGLYRVMVKGVFKPIDRLYKEEEVAIPLIEHLPGPVSGTVPAGAVTVDSSRLS